MDFEDLWTELEARLPPGTPGRMQQRVHPQGHADLFLSVANPGAVRSLILEVDPKLVAEIDELPSARGVAIAIYEGSSTATVELQLVDPVAGDMFTALATDVAGAASAADDDQGALRSFVGRLARWMRLLQEAPRGLSPERQRGLFAELWFLRELLLPPAGPEAAVAAWQAPANVPHDFQAAGGAIEVKSSAANQPQVVRVNGERQLDDTGTSALHLAHLSLDVHRDSGEALPTMVEEVRQAVRASPVEAIFEDRLLDSGYADVHEPLYRHIGYTLRDLNVFHVTVGFPRIVESDLAVGVGGVSYKLAIAACTSFRVPVDEAIATLAGSPGGH